MKILLLDCDSTLSKIEGIDEMARLQNESIFAEIDKLTHQAMNGEIPLAEIFSQRMKLIYPTLKMVALIGQKYIETVEPTAKSTLQKLTQLGWMPMILSGGFRRLIQPLGDYLKITEIHAVELYFDTAGDYQGYQDNYPTTRNGGKPEIIQQLKLQYNPTRMVMVGDGFSDLETQSDVDTFVGFGGFTERPAVKAAADHYIYQLDELLNLLEEKS